MTKKPSFTISNEVRHLYMVEYTVQADDDDNETHVGFYEKLIAAKSESEAFDKFLDCADYAAYIQCGAEVWGIEISRVTL